MKKRLKVLVSAYACNPYQGSEPGVGWGWVNAIAKYHDLWVLTRKLYQTDIERQVKENPKRYQNIRFYYIPRIRWLKLEKVWPPAYLWTYRLWQRAAYQLGAKLHEEINFDLVHQLTYVAFRVPGHLWKLNIPFVWGPIGGLENTPWRFLPMLGLKGCVYYACRNIFNSLHKRFLILPKKAFSKANGGIIAATEGIGEEIRRWYGVDSEVVCEVGPPPSVATNHSLREPNEPLKLVWSGLHLPGKALPLLLRAVAELPVQVYWRLNIMGQGPCTAKWQRLAKKLGINTRCKWHGWLPRDNAVSMMHDSHVFVITSLKDLTSTVLMEALSQGVPVICLDHCGFMDVVTASCGLKVPVQSSPQAVKNITEAIWTLWHDEDLRRNLAAGALRHPSEFAWDKKAEIIHKLYLRVAQGNVDAGNNRVKNPKRFSKPRWIGRE